jgi:putative ABC transport system substrate-binding protein
MKGTGITTVVAFGDPVATGLVASLAWPGANVTGISDNATTLSTRRLGGRAGSPELMTWAALGC